MLAAKDVLENTKQLAKDHHAALDLRDKGRLAEYKVQAAVLARRWTVLLRNTPPTMPLSRAASARRVAGAWKDAGAPAKVAELTRILTPDEFHELLRTTSIPDLRPLPVDYIPV